MTGVCSSLQFADEDVHDTESESDDPDSDEDLSPCEDASHVIGPEDSDTDQGSPNNPKKAKKVRCMNQCFPCSF